MGNLLLVDDERNVLEYISQLISEHVSSDIDIYTANSASDALLLLDKHKFDVVMTDIKMPGMNGVLLYKHIKANWPLCQVILLTGYRDFDTLYELAEDKEVVYLLKSESDETIVSTVTDAFTRSKDLVIARIRAQNQTLAQSLIAKQHALMARWNQGGIDELKRVFRATGSLINPNGLVYLAVFHAVSSIEPEDQQAKLLKLYSISEVVLRANFHYEWLTISSSQWLLIAQSLGSESLVVLQGALQLLQDAVRTPVVSVAVADCPVLLNEVWRLAQQLSSYALLATEKSTPGFFCYQVVQKEKHPEWLPWLSEFEVALDGRNFARCIRLLSEFDVLIHSQGLKSPQAQDYLQIVREMLVKSYYENRKSESLNFETVVPDQIGEIHALANRLYTLSNVSSNVSTDNLLTKLRMYISAHLDENLTLDRLAGIVYLNPSYLSRLFHSTFGINLSEFIVQERIRQAKLLLASEGAKITDISALVGYQSAHSFTRVFRAQTGLSPREYRLRLGEQQL